MKAWVLVHKRSGKIVPEGGISFEAADVRPSKEYSEEYAATPIEIPDIAK